MNIESSMLNGAVEFGTVPQIVKPQIETVQVTSVHRESNGGRFWFYLIGLIVIGIMIYLHHKKREDEKELLFE